MSDRTTLACLLTASDEGSIIQWGDEPLTRFEGRLGVIGDEVELKVARAPFRVRLHIDTEVTVSHVHHFVPVPAGRRNGEPVRIHQCKECGKTPGQVREDESYD